MVSNITLYCNFSLKLEFVPKGMLLQDFKRHGLKIMLKWQVYVNYIHAPHQILKLYILD